MNQRFALVDGDNFFVACEQVFWPKLLNKPVLIASSNDGCIIARNNTVKKLGIPMGAPIFQWQQTIHKHKVKVLSSNFHLYTDMSRRFITTLKQAGLPTEEYSIDECFIDVTGIPQLHTFLTEVSQQIKRNTGLSVSIGVGSTKGLAKIATKVAKNSKSAPTQTDLCPKICILPDDPHSVKAQSLLAQIPLEDVWGLGRKLQAVLRAQNCHTALDVQRFNALELRMRYSRLAGHIIGELNGMCCYPLHAGARAKRQQILCSRHFGHKQTSIQPVAAALAYHLEHGARKLRQQALCTGHVSIFLETTNTLRFNTATKEKTADMPPTTGVIWGETTIVNASDNTGFLTSVGQNLLSKIWQPGLTYRKCGIIYSALADKNISNGSLLATPDHLSKSNRLMHALDALNDKYGKQTLRTARQCLVDNSYLPKSSMRTPAWTTNWQEIPVVS